MEDGKTTHGENVSPSEARASFFTRKLASKMRQIGQPIPTSVFGFLDTPLCAMNDAQKAYFEEKFCPLIPALAALLEEVYVEMGADTDGWEDMLTYCGEHDTPIVICARSVLARKEKQAREESIVGYRVGLETKRIQLPPDLPQDS